MAKLTRATTLSDATNIVAGTGQRPNSVSAPPVIAYKISTESMEWINLLDKSMATDDPAKKVLIGLQVKFNQGALARPLITQLCFDWGTDVQDSFFLEGNHSLELKIGEAKAVEEKSSTDSVWYEVSPAALSSDIESGIYKKLDFYKDIDFVFFPLDQLQAVSLFYKNVVISGSEFKPGKKLYHTSTVGNDYGDTYFSLKVEGSDPNDNWGDATHATQGVAPGSSLIPGHPCPPDWQLFVAVMGAVYSSIPHPQIDPDKLRGIRKSFDKVVLQASTNVPSQA